MSDMSGLERVLDWQKPLLQPLRQHGWTDAAITALIEDWPRIHDAYLEVLLRKADTVTLASGGSPTQVRAWLLLLLHARDDITDFSALRTAWHDNRIAQSTDKDLLRAYRHAARDDRDLALLAFAAGLSDIELDRLRADGRVDRQALRAMIALNSRPATAPR